MQNKTRFSAGNLVSQGPRALSTYGVGRMRRLGRVPDALSQIGRLTRHDFRWPLNFPNLIISLARFGQVPEGQLASPGSIYPRTRRLIIEILQIWGWVSAAACLGTCNRNTLSNFQPGRVSKRTVYFYYLPRLP